MASASPTANLLTPPASSVAASSHLASLLPRPRRTPLKQGGTKEVELIGYLDRRINNVQKGVDNRDVHVKRAKKRKRGNEGEDKAKERNSNGVEKPDGYRSFGEVVKDLEDLIDVVWVSGTPKLQLPYLLTISSMIAEFIPLFSPISSPSTSDATHSTLAILNKLDLAFASLLSGHDVDSNELLPGFNTEQGGTHDIVSTTYKVRLKGVVQRTRLVVVRGLTGRGSVEGDDDNNDENDGTEMDESEADMNTDKGTEMAKRLGDRQQSNDGKEDDGLVKFEGFDNTEDEEVDGGGEENGYEDQLNEFEEAEDIETLVGQVYERTLGELGDVLGGPQIGVVTE